VRTALIDSLNETVRVMDVAGDDRSGPAVRPDRRFERAYLGPDLGSGTVFSTHDVTSGFVIELDDEVRLMTSQASYLLAPVRAARVITFEHSAAMETSCSRSKRAGQHLLSIYGFLKWPAWRRPRMALTAEVRPDALRRKI
jgi:hypothetical protein